jgi:hypothetical protein
VTLDLTIQELLVLVNHLSRQDVMIPQLWSAPMAGLQAKVAALAQRESDNALNPGRAQGPTPGASPPVSAPAPIFEAGDPPDGTD